MQAGDQPVLRIVKRSGDVALPRAAHERRFPPVVQVLTLTAPHIQQRLQDLAMIGFRNGDGTEAICNEVHAYARTLGYDVTIGVQEVRSDEMPSFDGSTVCSTLMLIDLRVPCNTVDPTVFTGDHAG
jgi:hypothetical protein